MSVDLFALLFTSAWYAASYLPHTLTFELLPHNLDTSLLTVYTWT